MSLGIRGSNPIWTEFDLQGKLFDDNCYLYILQNQIPYIPAIVYHDADLNVPWANPIQFFANGTLPIDIFYEQDTVYRLEFRRNNGINPPSQNDALLYEVNDYVPGSGGSNPVNSVAFASSNQVTNPQFALTNFNSPYTLSATNPDPIDIGPGWVLELAGTGTLTLTKVALNNTNTNPSNAPYALQLTLNGWTADSVFLRQRFAQNGMLWANKIVSSTITTRVQGVNQTINATLVDSNSATLGEVLTNIVVNESWNEFTGHADLGATSNPDLPPAAYIDYKLALPSNVDIYVSSIQLVVQDLPIEPSFEQDSIDRQIDHTYHTAYPIIPVGTVIDYYAFGLPDHYLDCNNQSLSRASHNKLFNALTVVETVTLTSGNATFSVVDGSIYAIGFPLEGTGIQAGATVTNIVGTTITMSLTANASGANAVRFFCTGNGDGSTTFNTPLLTGYVLAGAGVPAFTLLTSTGVGAVGGTATHAITIAEMPAHNHPGSTVNIALSGSATGPGGVSPVAASPTALSIASEGGGVAMSLVQPTRLSRKLIRFE